MAPGAGNGVSLTSPIPGARAKVTPKYRRPNALLRLPSPRRSRHRELGQLLGLGELAEGELRLRILRDQVFRASSMPNSATSIS